jgi:hypothetical protein
MQNFLLTVVSQSLGCRNVAQFGLLKARAMEDANCQCLIGNSDVRITSLQLYTRSLSAI